MWIHDGRTHSKTYHHGDLLVTPAGMPLCVRWKGDENCLQIQLSASFLERVAQEEMGMHANELGLVPKVQSRNPQLEAISSPLAAELHQPQPTSRLHLDSLAGVLAKQYYESGLPPVRLNRVLEFIDQSLPDDVR